MIVQDLLYAYAQFYMFMLTSMMFERREKKCIEQALSFFFSSQFSFVFYAQNLKQRNFHVQLFFLQKQLFCTSIVPSAKLLWQKTEIFMYCFPYMYIWRYFWLFHETIFWRKWRKERERDRRKNVVKQHIKTAVKDQTSAVFFFFFNSLLVIPLHSRTTTEHLHELCDTVICMYKQIQTNY